MAHKLPYSASIRTRPRANGTVAHDVRFRIEGSSRTVSFDTAPAAERWANIVRHIGPVEALALLRMDVKSTPTVAEFAERYIASKSGVEGRTTDKYRSYMRTSIGPAIGSLPLDAVTPERIATWINARADSGAAGKTIANHHGFLAAMFNAAVVAGHIEKSPCAGTRLPKTERQEMVFLSYREFDLLLSYIPNHFKPFVATLALTGMRFGEATALRPGDFDLDALTVRVSRAWKRSIDKGHYVGPPKTPKSRRTISFSPDLVAMLRPLLIAGNEYVFTTRDGAPIRQATFHQNTWDPARRLANGSLPFLRADGTPKPAVRSDEWQVPPADPPLGKMPRVHDLRHTHVSWLLADGVGLNIIQRRLGHESIKTTVDTYGHIAPDILFAPAAALNGKLQLTK